MSIAAVLPFRGTHLCPQCGMVNVPNTRQLCYGCSRPEQPRIEHVRSHLRAQDQPYFDWLLMPMTFDEIAEQMGPGWTRRQVEVAWHSIRSRLGLVGYGHLERLAVLRMVANLDPCYCGK